MFSSIDYTNPSILLSMKKRNLNFIFSKIWEFHAGVMSYFHPKLELIKVDGWNIFLTFFQRYVYFEWFWCYCTQKKLIKSWTKCDDLCKLLYSSFTAQDYISGGNVNNNEKDYTISPWIFKSTSLCAFLSF